jgi:hypothetical protein
MLGSIKGKIIYKKDFDLIEKLNKTYNLNFQYDIDV